MKVGFKSCKLETEDGVRMGDGMSGAEVKRLSFSSTGSVEYSDWKNHPERLESILEGLSQVKSIRDNLNVVDAVRSGLQKEEWEQMLKKHGFKVSWVITEQ